MQNPPNPRDDGKMVDINPDRRQNPVGINVNRGGQSVAGAGANPGVGNGHNMEQPAIAVVAHGDDELLFANFNSIILEQIHQVHVPRTRDELTNPPSQLSRGVFMNYVSRRNGESHAVEKCRRNIERELFIFGEHLVKLEYLQTLCERYEPALEAYETSMIELKENSRERRRNTSLRQDIIINRQTATRTSNNNYIQNGGQQQFQQQQDDEYDQNMG